MPPTAPARSRRLAPLLLAAMIALMSVSVSAAVITEGCVCSDVRPRVGTGATHVERFAVSKSCAEIKAAGQCDDRYMFDTVKELEGAGMCQLTCGRCTCCQPVATALKQAGLTAILDAATGTPYEEAWTDPAWMGVVLAPRSGPVTNIATHVLPPVAKWGNATWTADLLAAEESVMTAAGVKLDVRTAGGNTQIGGRARLVQGDIQACKAVIHVVDAAVA